MEEEKRCLVFIKHIRKYVSYQITNNNKLAVNNNMAFLHGILLDNYRHCPSIRAEMMNILRNDLGCKDTRTTQSNISYNDCMYKLNEKMNDYIDNTNKNKE